MLEDDLAGLEDEPRASGRQSAARDRRLVDARRWHDHEVRPVAGGQPSPVGLAGGERRMETVGANRHVERQGLMSPEDVGGRPAWI